MKEIPIVGKRGNGLVALIDDEDYELVSKHRWNIFVRKNELKARTSIKIEGTWKSVFMHRLIMGSPENMEIDHKNHNGLDNRKENLRICSRRENLANRRPWGTLSKYK